MFGQLSKVEQEQHSFIFLISGSEHLLYGICVSNEELLFSGNTLLTDTGNLEVRSNLDFFTRRVYCFISKFPFIRLHFEVIYSVIARERLRKIAFAVGVTTDEELEINKENNEVITILKYYYEVKVPTEDNSLTFQIPGELRQVEFKCLPGDEEKQIAEWGLITIIKSLSIDQIIDIFQSLLLEKQIVFVSKNLGCLSACVLSWLPLLRPYVFQGVVIPILPVEMFEYLDAPVPILMGISKLPEDEELLKRLESDKLIVYLDTQKLSFPNDVIPQLPEIKKLTKALSPIHKDIVDNKKKNQNEQQRHIPDIISAFRIYHIWLLDEILKSLSNLPIDKFDFDNEKHLEQLVAATNKNYREFISIFIRTQQFSGYSDKLIDVINKRTKNITINSSVKRHFKNNSLSDSDLITLSLKKSL